MTKRSERQDGFSLIEIMVVLLVIGILIAIAIPVFLGARGRSQDKASLSDLRSAAAAAKVYFSDAETYTNFDAGCSGGTCTAAEKIEPALEWLDDAPDANQVGIIRAVGTTLLLVSRSATGTYFCYVDRTNPSDTKFGKGTTDYASVSTAAKCAARPAP